MHPRSLLPMIDQVPAKRRHPQVHPEVDRARISKASEQGLAAVSDAKCRVECRNRINMWRMPHRLKFRCKTRGTHCAGIQKVATNFEQVHHGSAFQGFVSGYGECPTCAMSGNTPGLGAGLLH